MARLGLSLFCLTLILSYTYTSLAQNFIETSCKTTRYPTECIQALTPEAAAIGLSPLKLAQTALQLNLKKTIELHDFVIQESSKPETGPKDEELEKCLNDILDQLNESATELDSMGVPDRFTMKKSNVQTWLSAVIADYSACFDGYDEISPADQKINDPMQAKFAEAVHGTSNALALINQVQPGPDQPGAVQPGAVQPGAVQPGAVQPGAVQPGAVQPGAVKVGPA